MGRQKSDVSLISLDKGGKHRKKRKIKDYGSLTPEVAVYHDICQSMICDLKNLMKCKLPIKESFSPPQRLLMGNSDSVHSLPYTEHMQIEPMDANRGSKDITGVTLSSAFFCGGTSSPFLSSLHTQQDECNDRNLMAQSVQPSSELQIEHVHQPCEGAATVEVPTISSSLLDECNDRDILAQSIPPSSELQNEFIHESYDGAATVEVPKIFSSMLERLALHGVKITHNDSELFFESEVHEKQQSFPEQCVIHEPEKCVEEISNHQQQEKHVQSDQTPANLPVAEAIEETGSESDDDGLKRLWQDMAFSIACTDGQGAKDNSTKLISKNINECDHSFILKDDVGVVCDLCGLVGRDIETIFQFTWGKAHKRKQGKQQVHESEPFKGLEEELDDVKGQHFYKQGHQILTVHSDHREKMHEHQLDGFHFLEQNIFGNQPGGCILAHAPGTGKSFLIISFVQSFLQVHPEERVMLIAPKGMLIPWEKEFHKWSTEEIPLVNLYEANSTGKHSGDDENHNNDSADIERIRVSQFQIIKEWKMKKSVLLVSYPQFRSLFKGKDKCLETRQLLLETPGLLILDEGHVLRNKDSKIVKCLKHVHTKRRVLLSGTLFQNNFEELFNLFKFVRPDFMSAQPTCVKSLLEPLVGREWKEGLIHDKVPCAKSKRQNREALELKIFVESLGEKIESGNNEEKDHAIKMLRQLTESFVHWYKGQVLEKLPGLIDLTVVLNLTKSQEDEILSIESQAENFMGRGHKSARACIHPSLSNKTGQLEDKQNVTSQVTIRSFKSDEDPSQGVKIEFVLEMISLCCHLNEKVLVFSQYRPPLFLLKRYFIKFQGWVENKQILRLDGQTLPKDREVIIERFNNEPQAHVLLAAIKACGEGISLVGASRVICLDVPWNPSITIQAISRAFRIGQKKRVHVYRLVAAGSQEEDIHQAASKKEWLAKKIFEASENKNIELTIHEVDAQGDDILFESSKLRSLVKTCYKNT